MFSGWSRRRIEWAPSPSSGRSPSSKRWSVSASVSRSPALAFSIRSRTVFCILAEELEARPLGGAQVERDVFGEVRAAEARGQSQPLRLAPRDLGDFRRSPLLRLPERRGDLRRLRVAGPVGPEGVDE